MSATAATAIPCFCGLCIARCGAIATVVDGLFTRLDPDPTHPTGEALCAKGRAAPELVYSKERLTRPLRRTRPKGEADPGWMEISWDEALDATAAAMTRLAAAHGPQSVAFSQSSAESAPSSDGPGGDAASGDRDPARHRDWRLGKHRDANGRDAGKGAAERQY